MRLLYDKRINKHLKEYSILLDAEVKERTKELYEVNKKLKILANTDFLTGINNRGNFIRIAEKYFDISQRNKTLLQVLSLDLDYFKQVNDNYGHQAGDDVLKEFAKTITAMLRDSDLFGRVGGEEFCILLQNTSTDGAYKFAQRVCKNIGMMRVQCAKEMLQITVSIGMATLSDESSIEELIKKSDIALYKAKENGRNQVYVI